MKAVLFVQAISLMATVQLQFVDMRRQEAVLSTDFAPGLAADAKSKCVYLVCGLSLCQHLSAGKSIAKPIIARSAIFLLLIMLVLLNSWQVYACCDSASTETDPVKTTSATEPVFNLAAVALATDPETATAATEKEITSDAAATLAAVVESNFVKIAKSGEALAFNHATWECVEDKSNNLTWEVKKNDGGIRDKDHSYSWLYNIKGKNTGLSNGGRCKGGVNCDTTSYVRAMNEQKLCGYSDWRLPTRDELETLVEYNSNPQEATINKTYFPEAVPSWYWTASENPQRQSYAWYVLFRNGIALNDLKERPKHIRLVRGNRAQ